MHTHTLAHAHTHRHTLDPLCQEEKSKGPENSLKVQRERKKRTNSALFRVWGG